METASVSKVLQLFNMLSKSEQLEIADKIDKQTFKERWQTMDKSLPDANIFDEEVIQEVRAIRYGSKD